MGGDLPEIGHLLLSRLKGSVILLLVGEDHRIHQPDQSVLCVLSHAHHGRRAQCLSFVPAICGQGLISPREKAMEGDV